MVASASASATPPVGDSGEAAGTRFWCHECTRHVETRADDSGELCCAACGGNFVEEVEADDPPEQFLAATTTSASESQDDAALGGPGSRPQESLDDFVSHIHEGFGPGESTEPERVVTPRTPPSTTQASGFSRDAYNDTTDTPPRPGSEGADAPSPLTELLQQLVNGGTGGGGARTARIIRSNGTPVEFYVTSTGDVDGGGFGGGGLFGLLTGALNAPFGGGFAGNPGDYALGPNHLSQLINQLMQNDPNRHGAPPAAKEVVEKLPSHKVKQEEVDANAECAVCKDLFAVDDDAQDLPCSHSFHPDCIMPWLKMHNSCPVCRFELPTDDQDYEERRRHQEQDERHQDYHQHTAANARW